MRILWLLFILLCTSIDAQIHLRIEADISLDKELGMEIETLFSKYGQSVVFMTDSSTLDKGPKWVFGLKNETESIDDTSIHIRKGWYGIKNNLKKVLFKETVYHKFITYEWFTSQTLSGVTSTSVSKVDYMVDEQFVRFSGDKQFLYRGKWNVPFGTRSRSDHIDKRSIAKEIEEAKQHHETLRQQSLLALLENRLSLL